MKERRGHSARLEQNALNGRTYRQGGGDCFRHGWRPGLKNDLPLSIDDADMRLFHRDVQYEAPIGQSKKAAAAA
jgi:hypothetical protein